MPAPTSSVTGVNHKLEGELQQILMDVRALVADRNRAVAETERAIRTGWLQAAHYLDGCGHTAYGRALRREAGEADDV